MHTLIIVPTYNERENIQVLIKAIFNLNILDLRVLVIDDNSPDRTAAAVKKMQVKFADRLFLIKRPGKLGLGSAYIAGFNWALQHDYEFIFEMDADGSHDPADIPRLLAPVEQKKADVAIGSRRIQGGRITDWNWHRRLASWSAMTATRLILGLKTHDVTAGFRCYSRQALSALPLHKIKTNGYAFQEEMIWLCEKKNYTLKEIPITFKDRKYGKSKLGLKEISEFFLTLFRLKYQ